MKNRILNTVVIFTLLCFTVLSFTVNAQPGTLDGSFSRDGVNGGVFTTAIQSDGKIIIGGLMNHHIARLNVDGTGDTTFICGNGADALVYTIALQSDGKIIIGGDFGFYDWDNWGTRIARLNGDGTLDFTFGATGYFFGTVRTTAIQSDGKIIIGGGVTSYKGTARNNIARLNGDGKLDTSFNPGIGANNTVRTTAIQNDGKIIIGGDFNTYNGTTRNCIARLNGDGTLDSTFKPGIGANGVVRTTAIQSDGKIIIGGDFTSYNGVAKNRIARLNANGTLDTTFNSGTGADNWVFTTAVQSDGKIIIGGWFTTYNGTVKNHIARLNGDGTLDKSFNSFTIINQAVQTTAIQNDGKIIIGGDFFTYDGKVGQHNIARLNGDYGVGIYLSNIDNQYFTIFPNPSNGIFQLIVDDMQSSKGDIEIYNLFGEKVYAASDIKQQMQIDLSTLSKGVYFVKVYNGQTVLTKKIEIQ